MIKNNPLFLYIDSDFDSWNVVDKHPHVEKREINIKILEKDSTFTQMFTDPENQWVTQEELIAICTNRRDELNNEGWSNFFLLKSDTDFFVARVRVSSVCLGVLVFRFEDARVWFAENSHRMVVPATAPVILNSKPETLKPSFSSEVHTTTKEEHLVRYSGDKIESLAEVVKQQDLANAIKLVVDSGYVVSKK